MQFITTSTRVNIHFCFRCRWVDVIIVVLACSIFDRVYPSRIFHIIYCLHYLINNSPHNSLSLTLVEPHSVMVVEFSLWWWHNRQFHVLFSVLLSFRSTVRGHRWNCWSTRCSYWWGINVKVRVQNQASDWESVLCVLVGDINKIIKIILTLQIF